GAVQRNRLAGVGRERSQVVQAVQVVGVRMRKQNGVDALDLFTQQLQPQLRRRVDEEVPFRRRDQDGTTIALVAWVAGATHVAPATDHRNPDRGARTEEREGADERHDEYSSVVRDLSFR